MELTSAFASLLNVEDEQVVPEAPVSIVRQTIALPEYDVFLPGALSLVVDAGPGCGGAIWPAAFVLSRYLAFRHAQDPTSFAHQDVLELGSGTGIVSLAMAALEPTARIVATDIDDLLPLMRENVELNDMSDRVDVVELPWGEPIPSSIKRPTLILAADCVYFEPSFPLLVDTLATLLQDGASCLFCYKRRRKADKRFFQLARKRLTFTEVLDDPHRASYNRDDIHLYTITARQPLTVTVAAKR